MCLLLFVSPTSVVASLSSHLLLLLLPLTSCLLVGVVSGTLCFQELVAIYKYHLDDPLSVTSSSSVNQKSQQQQQQQKDKEHADPYSRGMSRSPNRSTSSSQSQSSSSRTQGGFQGKSQQIGRDGLGGGRGGGLGTLHEEEGGGMSSEGGVYQSPTRQKHRQQQQEARRGNEGRLQLVGMGEGWKLPFRADVRAKTAEMAVLPAWAMKVSNWMNHTFFL